MKLLHRITESHSFKKLQSQFLHRWIRIAYPSQATQARRERRLRPPAARLSGGVAWRGTAAGKMEQNDRKTSSKLVLTLDRRR